MKYLVKVTDVLSIRRTAKMEVEADSVQKAEGLAQAGADRAGLEWDEEQIDASPYEAQVIGLVACVGARFRNKVRVEGWDGQAGQIDVPHPEIWVLTRIDSKEDEAGPKFSYYLECQGVKGAALIIDHDDDESWADFEELP